MGTFTKIEPLKTPTEQSEGGQANAQSTAMQPATPLSTEASVPVLNSSEARGEKLRELKWLNDAGLISREVFLERQRKILE